MMSVESLKLHDAIAEASRCSICNGFLSCSPIRLLHDGSRICGHCAPPNSSTSYRRDFVLENILNLMSFPCRFIKQGCVERSLFGQVTIHENKCNYRKISCFATRCTWDGIGLKLFDHFIDEHEELARKKAEIHLKLHESKDGMFIVMEGPFPFIVKYLYDANNNFNYGIAYYANYNNYDVSVKITLRNQSDSPCVIHLPLIKCQTFDENCYELEKQMVLDLKKFYETLNNPDSIVILIDLLVTQVNSIVQSLDLPKCARCCNYLIPPLFKLNTNIVCYACGESNYKYLPLSNGQLSQLLKQINFPCHWRNCTFSGKYDLYQKHQASCKFYVRECFLLDCADTFTVLNAIDHYTSFHDAEYFVGKLVHTISFCREFDWIRKHTMIGDVYFLFEHTVGGEEKEDCRYTLALHSTISGGTTVSVHLEHQHCTIKPKPFPLDCLDFLTITLNDLPPCYKKGDEITVTINLE